MPHAIRFHKTGGPEVLVWEEVQLGKPGPGEARIRHTAVGLNFIDIYNRSGLYPVQLPSGLTTCSNRDARSSSYSEKSLTWTFKGSESTRNEPP